MLYISCNTQWIDAYKVSPKHLSLNQTRPEISSEWDFRYVVVIVTTN